MKIPPIELFNFMIENGLESFFGVPDSLLKDFCCCVDENVIDIIDKQKQIKEAESSIIEITRELIKYK